LLSVANKKSYIYMYNAYRLKNRSASPVHGQNDTCAALVAVISVIENERTSCTWKG